MASVMAANQFPLYGKIGDKIIVNGIETTIKISFQFVTGDEEYYNIKTKKGFAAKTIPFF